ncbi:MAG: hypothetical protein AAFW65_08900 [Pseudomonadota bacterium]
MPEDIQIAEDNEAQKADRSHLMELVRALAAFAVVSGVFVMIPRILDADSCCEVYAGAPVTVLTV